MATTIDALTISLGLDASGFKKGQQEARENLKATSDAATRTAKAMQADGAKAGEFFSAIKVQALSLLGIFLGGKGLETYIRDTTTSLAALGRQAANAGVSTTYLQEFGMAIARMGGNAATAQDSLEQFMGVVQDFRLHGGHPELLNWANQLGIDLQTATPNQVVEGFLRLNERHPGQAPYMQQVAKEIGMPRDLANSLLQMGTVANYRKELNESLKLGVASPEEIAARTELQTALEELKQSTDTVAREILNPLVPAITSMSHNLADYLASLPGAAKETLKALENQRQFDQQNMPAPTGLNKWVGDFFGGAGNSGVDWNYWLGGDMLRDRVLAHEGMGGNSFLPGPRAGRLSAPVDFLVRQEAVKRGLDPDHMARLFQQEAGTKVVNGEIVQVTSPAGAYGPAQLMPGTMPEVGVTHESSWQDNARGGLDYYQRLLKRFNGNYQAADAAYNAGPNNPGVLRFFQTGDLSGLPAETKNYVRSINNQGGPRVDPSLAPNRLAGPRSITTSHNNDIDIHIGAIHSAATNTDGLAGDIWDVFNTRLTPHLVGISDRGAQ